MKYRYLLPILALLPLQAHAGGGKKTIPASPEPNNGDWCDWLRDNPGRLYEDDDNPYIQKLEFSGRIHWQYAYVDGKGAQGAGMRDFNYDTEEIRRFRLGMEVEFLRYFELDVSVDLENDLAPEGLESDHDIEYSDIYSAVLSFDIAKAFSVSSFDSLEIGVGKFKVANSAEQSVSSRKIKTVERSAIANYAIPENSTGIVLSADKGPWEFELGIFSGDDEREFSALDGSNAPFYMLRVGRSFDSLPWFDEARVDLRAVVNSDDRRNQSSSMSNPNPGGSGSFSHDWVASLGIEAEKGRFALLADFIYGDNGKSYDFVKDRRDPLREGHFWGVVILPSYELVKNRLEAVFRYQYAHASEREGFRIGSRYSRRAGESYGFTGPNDLSDGRGDSHHSAYLGLNYFLCRNNAKIMVGVEYDDLDSGSQDVYEGYTAWAAFRMYF